MAKYTKHKGNLPEKVCSECGRPFSWRRKWSVLWNDVKYCSDKCRKTRGTALK
ncbi:MAG: DUF2256 domain-containing protein [Pseudomonadales bacterium]